MRITNRREKLRRKGIMRKAIVRRKTKEVDITLELNLDGSGRNTVETDVYFLDHMLSLFAKHGLFDLKLKAKGDTEIDIHHTNEDIAISLGKAFGEALKDKTGIHRFGISYVCMDEALVRCVLDLSGRPYLKIKPSRLSRDISCLPPDRRGRGSGYSYSYFKQFLKAFVDHARLNLHIDILEGEDFHHILEASFKALALALRQAVSQDVRVRGLPTTKGVID